MRLASRLDKLERRWRGVEAAQRERRRLSHDAGLLDAERRILAALRANYEIDHPRKAPRALSRALMIDRELAAEYQEAQERRRYLLANHDVNEAEEAAALDRDHRALQGCLYHPLMAFRPWVTPTGVSPQTRFLEANGSPTRWFAAGNRCGKTTIGVLDSLLSCRGWHPFQVYEPPIVAWVSVLTRDDGIGKVWWPAMRGYVDQGADLSCEPAWHQAREPQQPSALFFANRSELHFKTAKQGRRMYQGARVHKLFWDEEHPEDVMIEGRMRLADVGGTQSIMATQIDALEHMEAMKQERGCVEVNASLREAVEAGIADRAYVELLKETLSEREIKIRLDGLYAPRAGLVYPGFSREANVATPVWDERDGREWLRTGDGLQLPWPIPDDWESFAAHDFGFSVPNATLRARVQPGGERIVIDRCYYKAGIRPSLWAGHKGGRRPRGHEHDPIGVLEDLGELAGPIICDHDPADKDEFHARGFLTYNADKTKEAGLNVVARWLEGLATDRHRRLIFVEHERGAGGTLAPPRHGLTGRCDAERLIWEIRKYKSREQEGRPQDAPDEPIKKDDHAMDALRYLLMFLNKRLGYGDGRSLPAPTEEVVRPDAPAFQVLARPVAQPGGKLRRKRGRPGNHPLDRL